MAEAISQNKETIDLVSNIIQYPSLNIDADGNFSNLLNNISTKVEQTQTKFIDNATKVTKTNTSSVNQYAIDSEKNKIQNPIKDISQSQLKPKPKTQNTNSENTTKPQSAKTTNEDNNIAQKSADDKTVIKNGKKYTSSKENVVQSPVSKKQTKVQTNNESISTSSKQINNDSLESSPVSLKASASYEEQSQVQVETTDNTEQTLQDDVAAIVENILITFDIPINVEGDDNSVNLESVFGSADSESGQGSDFIVNCIDEISSQIDSMDLNQGDKDSILSAFNKLKEGVQKIQDNENLKSEIEDVKKLMDSIISKAINKGDDAIQTEQVLISNNEINKLSDNEINQIKEIIKDIKEVADKLIKTTKNGVEALSEAADDIKKLLSELDNNIEQIAKDNSISVHTQKLAQTLKALSEKVENELKTEASDIEKPISKIVELVENLKSKLQLNKIADNKDSNLKSDLINETKTEIKSVTEAMTDDNKGIGKFEIQKNDDIAEIVSKLKEFEKTQEYQEISEEDKVKIREAINKLSLVENKETKERSVSIENIKEEIDSIISSKETEKSDSVANNSEDSDTISFKNDSLTTNNDNSSDNKQNEQKYFKENKNIKVQQNNEKTKTTTDSKISFDTKKEAPDSDVSDNMSAMEDNIEIDVNAKNDKASVSFIKELKEDFLENISYSNETPSALTVADEVVKIALNENNSLSSVKPVGNITYDPANNAIKIKNVQNIAQTQAKETSQPNILNQIGDKLYQLKDSQRLTLVLRPNDLGRLSVELTSDKNGLTTNIIAQNEHVRTYIEKNINTLRSQLSEAGINVNSIQIKTAGQNNASTYDGNQNREFQQEQQNQQNPNQQNQNRQQRQNQGKNEFAGTLNYDMHFAKDFSSVLNKTLSYIN